MNRSFFLYTVVAEFEDMLYNEIGTVNNWLTAWRGINMEEFLKAYKYLERACDEMYGQIKGLARYISEMERTPIFVSEHIPGWEDELNRLKRVRHIRNAMADDPEGEDARFSGGDIAFLNGICGRIKTKADMLSQSKAQQSLYSGRNRQPAPVKVAVVKKKRIDWKYYSKWGLVFAGCVAVGLLLVLLGWAISACIV